MKFSIASSLCLSLAIACSLPVHAAQTSETSDQVPSKIFAQQIADNLVAEHRDLRDVIFHVTPPGSVDNVAIASFTTSERGRKSGPDDLGVIKTGKPLVEVQKDGVRIGVLLPLEDADRQVIGALGLVFSYRAGQDPYAFLLRAEKIRDQIASEIISVQALVATEH